MHYPNPLHYDERWAAESRWGEIVAPQSFTVACDTSHGASPAQVGKIPGLAPDLRWRRLVVLRAPRPAGRQAGLPPHAVRLQGGGHQVRRPDLLPAGRHPLHQPEGRADRAAALDGDPLPGAGGQGEGACSRREAAPRRADGEPEWTDEQLAELEERKLAFIDQIQTLGHDKRLFSSVSAGDGWPSNVLGPAQPGVVRHRVAGLPHDHLGRHRQGPDHRAGRGARLHEGDGRASRATAAWSGSTPSSPTAPTTGRHAGHLQPRWARHVGMPRGYGYGASMGAWVLDYVAAWAGEWGTITHSSAQYRNPALHRRRHVPQRRGRRHPGRAQAGAHRGGEGRDAQPGRRQDGHGHRRGRAAGGVRRPAGAPAAPPRPAISAAGAAARRWPPVAAPARGTTRRRRDRRSPTRGRPSRPPARARGCTRRPTRPGS